MSIQQEEDTMKHQIISMLLLGACAFNNIQAETSKQPECTSAEMCENRSSAIDNFQDMLQDRAQAWFARASTCIRSHEQGMNALCQLAKGDSFNISCFITNGDDGSTGSSAFAEAVNSFLGQISEDALAPDQKAELQAMLDSLISEIASWDAEFADFAQDASVATDEIKRKHQWNSLRLHVVLQCYNSEAALAAAEQEATE